MTGPPAARRESARSKRSLFVVEYSIDASSHAPPRRAHLRLRAGRLEVVGGNRSIAALAASLDDHGAGEARLRPERLARAREYPERDRRRRDEGDGRRIGIRRGRNEPAQA